MWGVTDTRILPIVMTQDVNGLSWSSFRRSADDGSVNGEADDEGGISTNVARIGALLKSDELIDRCRLPRTKRSSDSRSSSFFAAV